MPGLFIALYGLFWLLVVVGAIMGLIYVINNRMKQREKEDFEQRDN